jgi:transcriptional regulator with XRE-family HTH domain
MARRTMRDPGIGDRIKDRREILGWSVRFAASRAEISHATWSRIERGEQSADNRFVLAAIALALRCPVVDLTGQTATTTNGAVAELDAAAYETVLALTEADLVDYDPSSEPRPVAELRREVDLIRDLCLRCDFIGANRRLPDAIRQIHATVGTTDRDAALGLLVEAAEASRDAVRYTNQAASAGFIAERGRQAAQLLDDPVMVGLSGWTVVQAALAAGRYRRAAVAAERSFDTLASHADAPRAKETIGQLLMCAAFARYALGDIEAATTRIGEASRLAEQTGDTDTFGLYFGPTNIGIWQVGMEADGGEPGRALEIAADINPAAINSRIRQVSFYLDTGRALARLRQDERATRMLLTVERLAPQRLRSDPLVNETLRGLLDRSQRNAIGVELRGLCERIGMPG